MKTKITTKDASMNASQYPLPVSPVEEQLRRAISQALASLGISVTLANIPLEHPAIEEQGDWATPVALQVFGQRAQFADSPLAQAQSPRQAGELIAQALEKIRSQDGDLQLLISKIEVAGPGFLNIRLAASYWASVAPLVLEQQEKYGQHQIWADQVWEVEHTSANPNKAMHLGHLRNNVTGMSVANIWEAMGAKVIRDAVDNNRGIAIAKLMWGFLKFARKSPETPVTIETWITHPELWHTPESAHQRPDRFMDALYVQAAQDCEANPESEQTVREWVSAWESKDPAQWKLWAHVLEYVYAGQNLTLERLHNRFDTVWHEHEHYEAGKDLVQEGLTKGVFRQLEDGAILTNLEAFGLPDTIVQKKDGTALYITQDLALTKLKKETYHANRMVWVIGPEQSLAMQQLFAVCEQLGIGKRESFEHLSFGYMSIKGQGKMSSRKGNTIFIDDVLDLAKQSVLERIAEQPLTPEEKENIAELLAESAVKYTILKVGRTTDTQFDLDQAVSLEGDAGPYLQYAHARCRSILRQAGEWSVPTVLPTDLQPSEINLLRWLERFPEVVALAADQAAPNALAQYLYELAQRFSAFYAHVSVLQAETPDLRAFRLSQVAAVAQVLKNGFGLLGFAAIEKM